MVSPLYSSGFCNTPLWDKHRTWNTAVPELTPCFEDTVLVWIPVAFLWLSVYLRSYLVSGSSHPGLECTLLGAVRYACSLGLLVLTGVFTLFEFIEGSPPATLLAGGLKTFTYGIVYLQVISDRQRGQSRHTLLWFFWLAMCVLELPSYYRMLLLTYGNTPPRKPPSPSEYSSRVVTYPLLVIQLILFSLSDSDVQDFAEERSPSERATPPSYAVFEWVTSFILSGYRKTLTIQSMLRIPQSLQSRYNFNQWNVATAGETLHPPFLAKTFLRLFWPRVLLGSVLYLSSSILKVTAGLFLYLIVRHVQDLAEEPWKGYFYASIMFIVSSVSSLTLQHANMTLATVGLRIKALLATAVYTKTLRISLDALRRQASDITSSISIDADNASQFPSIIAVSVTAPVTVLYTGVLLWRFLGPPSLAGMVILIVLVLTSSLIAQRCHGILNLYTVSKRALLKYISNFFSNVEAARDLNMQTPFLEKVRAIDLDVSLIFWAFVYWSSVMSAICTSAPFIISLFAFLPYMLGNSFEILQPSTAFVSLYLFDAMFLVLLAFPELLSGSKNAKASADKIEAFLLSNELDRCVEDTDEDQVAISIKDAAFAWSPPSPRALSAITLTVHKGQLVAIVGPPGSGKSSLLSAMTGNLVLEKGSIAINGSSSVAYVPQEPWILNATVKQNILLSKAYDEASYNIVLQVTCLKQVLETLPHGENTSIGSRGINLSKDLNQRIGLARAIYQDRDIYLLDNPLSAVDSHVGETICGNVIERGGILQNKTRLLASRNLSTSSTADAVVLIREREVAGFRPCQSSSEGDVELAKYINEQPATRAMCIAGQPDVAEDTPLISPKAETVLEEATLHPSALSGTEELYTPKRMYLRYGAHAGTALMLTALISLIVSRASTIGAGLWLSDVTMYRVPQPLDQSPALAVGIYFLLVILQAVSSAVATATVVRGSFSVVRAVRDRVVHSALGSGMSSSGTSQTKVSVLNDMILLDAQHPLVFSRFLEPLFNLLALTIFTSTYEPLFLIASVVLFALYRLVQSGYLRCIQQVKRIEGVSRRTLSTYVSDTVAGASTIRGCAMEEDFIDRFESTIDDSHSSSYSALVSKLWTSTRLDLVSNVLILIVGIIVVSLRCRIGEGPGSVLMYYAMSVSYSFVNMAYGGADVQGAVAAYGRLEGYCKLDPEESRAERTGGPDDL